MLKPGQVVVTAGGKDWTGRILTWGMGSPWTHCFMVTGLDELVEAQLGQGVTTYSLRKRMEELRTQGRAYIPLGLPGLTRLERIRLITQAKSYAGRPYDLLTSIFWFLFGKFYHHGKRHMVCSRLVSAAYQDALGIKLFEKRRVKKLEYSHQQDLLDGYCTPDDIVHYSRLIADRKLKY